MVAVTIDEKQYESDDLSPEALDHLKSIRTVDQEIARLKRLQAIATTARNAYGQALKALLPKAGTEKKKVGKH